MWGWVLGIATVLGGLSAGHYFWEGFRGRKTLAPGNRSGPEARPEGPTSLEPVVGADVEFEGEPEAAFPWETSTTLFGWRMAKTFPGEHGIVVLEGEAAVDRLAILLEPPLTGSDGSGQQRAPFWWFRGGLSCSIEEFVRVSACECIMGPMELYVRRIAACRDADERREFVYVEMDGQDPTGLYPVRTVEVGKWHVEEYAIFGEHLLTLAEFMDGYTMIDGEPVRTVGAARRVRFLSPYNLIITGKSSPLNSSEYDTRSRPIFKGILRGEAEIEDLVKAGEGLPFHYMRGSEVW